jgi:hypothetical protein
MIKHKDLDAAMGYVPGIIVTGFSSTSSISFACALPLFDSKH